MRPFAVAAVLTLTAAGAAAAQSAPSVIATTLTIDVGTPMWWPETPDPRIAGFTVTYCYPGAGGAALVATRVRLDVDAGDALQVSLSPTTLLFPVRPDPLSYPACATKNASLVYSFGPAFVMTPKGPWIASTVEIALRAHALENFPLQESTAYRIEFVPPPANASERSASLEPHAADDAPRTASGTPPAAASPSTFPFTAVVLAFAAGAGVAFAYRRRP